MKKQVSVIVPFYNEAAGLKLFLDDELLPEITKLEKTYLVEIVLVDDGSTDRSLEIVKSSKTLETFESRTKLISFCRNFGKEIALTAGIKYAGGDAVIMIDADGQHPVAAISEMLERWENGAKIVTAIRKGHKTKHRLGSAVFYKLMRALGSENIVAGAMDFRLIDREVADAFNQFTEHNRIARGLIDWLGYPQEYITVRLNSRVAGKGTYNRGKLLVLASNSFISMTRTPLLFFGYLGIFITIFSLIFGLFILIQQYILGDPLHLEWSGAVAMCVFISFLVGLVLVSQAITALYVSQIHTEGKNRPLFVINKAKSFNVTGTRQNDKN